MSVTRCLGAMAPANVGTNLGGSPCALWSGGDGVDCWVCANHMAGGATVCVLRAAENARLGGRMLGAGIWCCTGSFALSNSGLRAAKNIKPGARAFCGAYAVAPARVVPFVFSRGVCARCVRGSLPAGSRVLVLLGLGAVAPSIACAAGPSCSVPLAGRAGGSSVFCKRRWPLATAKGRPELARMALYCVRSVSCE